VFQILVGQDAEHVLVLEIPDRREEGRVVVEDPDAEQVPEALGPFVGRREAQAVREDAEPPRRVLRESAPEDLPGAEVRRDDDRAFFQDLRA